MYVLSLLRAWRLSQDVLVDVGFQCEKASVLREIMKETRCTSAYTRNLSDLEFDQALSLPNPHPFAVIFVRWTSGYQASTIAPPFFKSCPYFMITSLGAVVPRPSEGSADFPLACLNRTYIWISNISTLKRGICVKCVSHWIGITVKKMYVTNLLEEFDSEKINQTNYWNFAS